MKSITRHQSRYSSILFGSIGAILITSLASTESKASTWSGLGQDISLNPDPLWSNAANWDALPAGTVALVFPTGPTNVNTTNDISGITASSITFDATGPAYTLGGAAITLGGNVTNNSTSTQTINLGLQYGAARTVAATSGPISLGGVITNTANSRVAFTLTSGAGVTTSTILNNFTTTGGTASGIALTVGANSVWTLLDNATNTQNSLGSGIATANGGQILIQNGGTFNFGTPTSAPKLVTAVFSDSISVGSTAGGVLATINVVNGTLTAPGINVGNTAGAQTAFNVSGGTVTFGSGTTGNNFGLTVTNQTGTGAANISGGTVNVINNSGLTGTGTTIVSQRGNGTLTLTGGLLQTGTLTISSARVATQTGVVNLNAGGALEVGTGGINTSNGGGIAGGSGTFNFDGGTLRMTGNNSITQSTGTVIPLTLNVKAGGAIFNTNGFNTSVNRPLVDGGGGGGLTKNDNGNLTLSTGNTSTYTGATTINGGKLIVSGALNGTSGVLANSTGTLAGAGSITTALGGNVTLASGSFLEPGSAGPGNLTLNLDPTGQFNIGGAATGSSAAFKFELASLAGTSDVVTLTGGTLNIGTGVLTFDDFVFTDVGGLQSGTYTLINTNSAVSGFLATDPLTLTGSIGAFTGTIGISQDGQDVVLDVVPEPSTGLAILGGLATLAGLSRRRSRDRRS